ncbi:MAG TPA: hypothetical protein VJQ44_18205 [Gemmatimonadales bacterium]|nr:hypothetical protein [Gemmatimonadales bacterium]
MFLLLVLPHEISNGFATVVGFGAVLVGLAALRWVERPRMVKPLASSPA